MKIARSTTQKRWFMTFGKALWMSVSVTKRAALPHPLRMEDVVVALRTPLTVLDAGQFSLGSEALYTIRNSAGDVEVRISLRRCAQ